MTEARRTPAKLILGTLVGAILMPSMAWATDCGALDTDDTLAIRQINVEGGSTLSAILATDATSRLPWSLHHATGETLSVGYTMPRGLSEAAGQAVHEIRLTAPSDTQTYTLSVCEQLSVPLTVSAQPYDTIAEDALRYFYLNRAGTDIEMPRAGHPRWARAAGHIDEIVTCFQGTDKWGVEWPGCEARFDVSGGWYDAGDYGKYTVPAGQTVWMLLNAYERAQSQTSEQAQAVPATEILDEARWALEWMMSMQVPQGTRLAVPASIPSDTANPPFSLREIDASGLAFSKVHERNWLALPLLPENADETRYVYYPTTAATLNLAAVTAMCGRIWISIDADFAEKCFASSQTAYAAAKRNPEIFAFDNFDGGGPYDDMDMSDEFAWAATELFLTTGDGRYISQMSETPGLGWLVRARSGALRDLGWADTDLQAAISLLANPDLTSDNDRRQVSEAVIEAADRYLKEAREDGYGVPYPADGYGWGSNGAIALRGMVMAYAHEATGERRYRDGTSAVLGYLTGRNPLQQSYVAGHGQKAMRHAHHRFWAEGKDGAFPPAAPGALSGGPNARNPVDPIARRLNDKGCAPQMCWVDHVDAYALNEVAIYWNGSLFWIADYLAASK